MRIGAGFGVAILGFIVLGWTHAAVGSAAERKAFFGELHIHSGWSHDSYLHGVRASPEDAYRYNLGKAILHTSGYRIQARAPLDFMALTDHAEFFGFTHFYFEPGHPLYDTKLAELVREPEVGQRYWEYLSKARENPKDYPLPPKEVSEPTLRSNWKEYVAAAERYNRPGEFTTFVGYEWTADDIHRNVIFRGPEVPDMPFSANDSPNPEALWDWMDNARAHGSDLLSIPHNPNISDGKMFPMKKFDGSAIDRAYAEQRMRNEPLVEVSQIKGTSETHPALSPYDEWAGFEILATLIARHERVSKPEGSYVRNAYLRGLGFSANDGFNPYKFGMIGSSDGHNASSPVDEESYHGKLGNMDGTPKLRRESIVLHPVAASYSAAGLAGVWAEANTRESIFDALRRKETFATSGTRIKVLFFGGWDLPQGLLGEADWEERAYRYGVPMGSDLPHRRSGSGNPRFAVWALKDPASAWLQRIQIIKGWIEEDGEAREAVYDVVCSDGLTPDGETFRCPDNGAGVDLETCDYSRDTGDVMLSGVWEDPDFDPDEDAFYYLRVLENPTCRWSTWEANRNGWELLADVPPTLQERAWSSPIWYTSQE